MTLLAFVKCSRSYETVNEHFRDLVLGSQDILAKPEHWEKVLAIIPDEEVQAQVRAAWEDTPGRASEQKWDDLLAIFRDAKAAVSSSAAVLLSTLHGWCYVSIIEVNLNVASVK